MVDWGKRVFLGSLLGAALGVLLGLGLARLVWPGAEPTPPAFTSPTSTRPEVSPSPLALLEPDERWEEVVVLVGALYALDGDLERARERLSALGFDDAASAAAEAVAELALRHAAAGNHQVAVDLATLAAALGEEGAEVAAYVATATPTASRVPTLTPTPMPTLTSSPVPTPTPTPSPTPTLTLSPAPSPVPTRLPPTRQAPTATPPPPAATPLPLDWDHRVDLLSPPVKLIEASVAPGQPYWRLVRLEWWKPSEGGNTLLYISTLNETGQPVWGQEVIVENGGHTVLVTQPKPGEPHGANFPMSSTLNSYQAFVGGELPSDRVVGMGLGEWHGSTDHTTFVLEFQRSTK